MSHFTSNINKTTLGVIIRLLYPTQYGTVRYDEK